MLRKNSNFCGIPWVRPHWLSSPCADTCCSSNSRATAPLTWSLNFSSYTRSSWFHTKDWRLYWSEQNWFVYYSYTFRWIEKEGKPLFWCYMQRTELLKSICIFPEDRFWHSSFPGWCQHDTCTTVGKTLSIPLLQKIQLTHLKHEET